MAIKKKIKRIREAKINADVSIEDSEESKLLRVKNEGKIAED